MLLLDTGSLSLLGVRSMAGAVLPWAGEFQVKIIGVCLLFEVSKCCRSGACQFRRTEQRLLLCLNFVVQGRLMEIPVAAIAESVCIGSLSGRWVGQLPYSG